MLQRLGLHSHTSHQGFRPRPHKIGLTLSKRMVLANAKKNKSYLATFPCKQHTIVPYSDKRQDHSANNSHVARSTHARSSTEAEDTTKYPLRAATFARRRRLITNKPTYSAPVCRLMTE